MKTTHETMNSSQQTAQSVLECGSPPPLSIRRVRRHTIVREQRGGLARAGESAGAPAQSRTWRLLGLAPRASRLALALLLFSTLNPQLSTLHAQGTAFTYQGRLTDNGAPFTGVVEMDATLWDAATNGNPIRIGHSVPVMVEVTNGLFTVELDFRKGAFPGEPRWLQIDLRTSPDPAPFTTLWPRQRIAATPYAITAENVTGIVPSEGLFGGYGNALWFDNTNNYFAGRGYDLTDLNASELTSGTVPLEALGNAWKVGGNSGTTPGTHFLGTTDNRPVELKANGIRALLLQPHPFGLATVNVIGGPTNNQIAPTVVSATIGGGFNNTIQPDAHYTTIGGGEGNSIHSNAAWATLAGGRLNTIQSNAQVATIGGGIQNTVRNDAQYAAIGGGFQNIIPANASFATIPGGRQNSATDYGFAAGRRANAAHTGSFVWADSQDASFASTASNQFSVRASGGAQFVTGGAGATLDGQSILAGQVGPTEIANASVNMSKLTANSVSTLQLVDGGVGAADLAVGAVTGAALADGAVNMSKLTANSVSTAQIVNGTVAAADVNSSSFGTTFWKTDGNAGTTAGTHFLGTTDNQPFEFKVNGNRALRLEPTASNNIVNVIGGSPVNHVMPGVLGATIGGGGSLIAGFATSNSVGGNFGTIGGGVGNTIESNAPYATVSGGNGNIIRSDAWFTTISGGWVNTIEALAQSSTIGGGWFNKIERSAELATISGGWGNTVQTNALYASIGGGRGNFILVNSEGARISGGVGNRVQNGAIGSTIAGGIGNVIQSNGLLASISGGRGNTNGGFAALIGSGEQNTIRGNGPSAGSWGVIAGGLRNLIEVDNAWSAIGGGVDNAIGSGQSMVIAGGVRNVIESNGLASAVGGGSDNLILSNANAGAIGGGFNNRLLANAEYATIPGGRGNSATNYGFAAGRRAKAIHTGAFVWADAENTDFPSGVTNEFAVRASGGARFVTGGAGMTLDGQPVLAGVIGPTDIADNSVNMSKLTANSVSTLQLVNGSVGAADLAAGAVTGSALADGSVNMSKLTANSVSTAQIVNGTVTAADVNPVSFATTFWKVDGNAGTTPGTHFLGTTDNQLLELRVNGALGWRLEPGSTPNVIGGDSGNTVTPGAIGAVIAGGSTNSIQADFAAIGGGQSNVVAGIRSVVGGGVLNRASGQPASTVAGGLGNTAAGQYTTVGGGRLNTAHGFVSSVNSGQGNIVQTNADHSVIGGGLNNLIDRQSFRAVIAGGGGNYIGTNADYGTISGGQENDLAQDSTYTTIGGGFDNDIGTNSSYSTIGGGTSNRIGDSSLHAVIPGGRNNAATNNAFAAGTRAKANHTGSFVWADSQDADFASTAANQVSFRCTNGVRFTSGTGAANQTVAWAPGAASWTFSSDRHLKEKAKPVDAQMVLDKVARLPVSEWNFKHHPQRHIGPMAQDFHALFPLNDNDKMIDSGDLHGVALAAIQGLNEKVEVRSERAEGRIQKLEEQLKAKDTEIRELRQSIAELKETFRNLTTKTQE